MTLRPESPSKRLRLAVLALASTALFALSPPVFAESSSKPFKPEQFIAPAPSKPADVKSTDTKPADPAPTNTSSPADEPADASSATDPADDPAANQPDTADTPADDAADAPEKAEAPIQEEAPAKVAAPAKAEKPAKEEASSDTEEPAEPEVPAKASAKAPSIPSDVEMPTDPVEKAAFDVLERNCSRCHQSGMLTTREKPAKNFGNILKLKELVADPHMIQPGNPDGSKILQQLINKEMPYDLYYEFDSSVPEIKASDIDALRAWIKQSGDQESAACNGREFISPTQVVKYIGADLREQRDYRVTNMRYLTLTNLYNSCSTDEAMEVYRQGVVKLLNSFARTSDVVKLKTIDPYKTIISFNLDDLGWKPDDWDKVLSVYVYGTRPDSNEFGYITEQTHTVLPYVRADWFTFTASQPPLYDILLQLPDTFAGLEEKLGLNVNDNIRNYTAKRAGFQKSGVSANNRLIERHPISTGYFWTSYDMGGNKGVQSLFLNPLGPTGIGFEHEFHHDGGETIFSLPNGFQSYYLNKSDGTRLDKGPVNIVRDPSRRDLSVTNGISCMGCHDQGIRKARDEIRKTSIKERAFSKETRDIIEALYPEHDEMDAILADDFSRFNSAMKRAGLDPTLKLNGIEMTNALFKRYEDDLSLRRAAAEYGYEPEEFQTAFISAGADAVALMRRLEQGIVPRDQFEGLFLGFVEGSTDEKVIDITGLAHGETVVAAKPVSGSTFDLRLNADKSAYNQGDTAVFNLMAGRDCNLFVVNVDQQGTGTIIFPNKFQKTNAVKAGETITLGGPSSPFKFRLADKGKERVVAVCRIGGNSREAFGQRIDTEKDTFTQVPKFDEAMSRQIVVEAAEVHQEAAGLDADSRKDAQNAKISTLKAGKVAAGAPASAKQTVASAAIVLQVH